MSSLSKSRETTVIDPLSLYLLQMTEEALLSAEEEVRLAKYIEAGRIAEERIRQLQKAALRKLHRSYQSKRLRRRLP